MILLIGVVVARKLRDVEILCLTLKATVERDTDMFHCQSKQSAVLKSVTSENASGPFTLKANMDPGLTAEKVVEDVQGRF